MGDQGAARAFETVARAKKLNRRMHDKLLIADNQMAILGGRNIGDHYFGLHHKYNFHDLDMIVVGDAAGESSEIFDHFWNSDRVIPATAFVKEVSWETIEEGGMRNSRSFATPMNCRAFRSRVVTGAMTSRLLWRRCRPAPRRWSTTSWSMRPMSARTTRLWVWPSSSTRAQREVLIVNAYIIPGDRMMEIFRNAAERGVRVRVLTNSLASNDVPAVTAKYKKYRKPLIEAGVELYEFSAHPEIQAGVVDTDPVEAKFAGLHTKALVVDRESVYIGSLNLDPRSIQLNTEMGMIVTSTRLAEEVAAIAERDMAPANSWRVRWTKTVSSPGNPSRRNRDQQPAQSCWQRVQAWFFKIVPEGQL